MLFISYNIHRSIYVSFIKFTRSLLIQPEVYVDTLKQYFNTTTICHCCLLVWVWRIISNCANKRYNAWHCNFAGDNRKTSRNWMSHHPLCSVMHCALNHLNLKQFFRNMPEYAARQNLLCLTSSFLCVYILSRLQGKRERYIGFTKQYLVRT